MTIDANLYRLIWLSRPLMQKAEELVEKNLAGTGLSVRMRAVLEILLIHGDKTVPDIAHLLHIQRQYVQVMVNEALKEAYVEKKPNPRHRSSFLICLTDAGTATIENALAIEQAFIKSIAPNFNAGEVEAALSVVEKLLANLSNNQIKEKS